MPQPGAAANISQSADSPAQILFLERLRQLRRALLKPADEQLQRAG